MRSLILFLFILPFFVSAQKRGTPRPAGTSSGPCTVPITLPSGAIPVCGLTVFNQSAVYDCTGPDMNPAPLCSDPFSSSRSIWYRFSCFTSGTLGFLITPSNVSDDYDWILYDITGHLPDDVFTTPSLVVSVNGSGTTGPTGCSTGGVSNAECYDSPLPLNRMPNLIAGHSYLLMVSNFSLSIDGYGLSFGGGTTGLVEGTPPDIHKIIAGCNSVRVIFSTDIRCASVTPTGSEFSITPGTNTITGITSNCATGFNSITELTINFLNPLTPGNYNLKVNTGTDANTFKNVCDQEIAVGSNYDFTIDKPRGSFTAPAKICFDETPQFTSTSDPIAGNTVTEYHWNFGDGTGDMTSATANTSHNYTLATTYTVKHWIVNNFGCYSDTASEDITVNPLPTVNETITAPYCGSTVTFFSDQSVANTGILTGWTWDFGDPASGADNTSALQNPAHIFTTPGLYTIQHTATNSEGCKASAAPRQIFVNERPHADFIPPEVCLNDTYAQFNDASTISSGTFTWAWDFGDGNAAPGNPNTSVLQNPTHSYTAVGAYDVRLIVTSNTGCNDTITKQIFVNGSFPKAIFTVANEASLCVNTPVTITNTSTVFPGSITKLEIIWDNVNAPAVVQTDNTPANGSAYSHVYPDFNAPLFKTIDIHVRAYSGGVCADDSIRTITLYASPKLQFNAIPDTCLLVAPFQITQASELAGVPGSKQFSGVGIIDAANGIFSPQVAGVGTHIITYTYTSSAGCIESKTSSIKVLDTASAKFSYVIPACDGSAITFNDESTVPAGVVNSKTVWDFNDGSAVETHNAGLSFTHLFPGWGTYHVKMYTISAYGCNSNVITNDVVIHPLPRPKFSFPSKVCLPDGNITFTNASSIPDGTENTFSYTWNFGDAGSGAVNTSHAFEPMHSYIAPGPYNVNLQILTGAGCTHDTTIVLDVIHPQPKADFTTNRKTACLGEDIIFTNTTDPLQGTTASINWDMGDKVNTSLHTQTVDYTYIDTLTYNVSLYIVNSIGCHSDTAYRNMKVYPNPIVNAGNDTTVLTGTTTRMKAVVSGVETQYLWTPDTYFNNGNNTILAPLAVNITNDITYTLQVFARGGCMRMDQVYIKVLKDPVISNTFTPNGDGINDKWEITYLKDFPNSKVQVFTKSGQKIFESTGYGKPWDGTYNGKPLPLDTYYYIIEPGNRHDPITGYITILK